MTLKPLLAPRERLPALDLLRTAAILLVISWHFPSSFFPYGWRPATWAGVDLFFVLSGYLIGAQLLRPYTRNAAPSYWDFFFRRALRVLPAFGAVLGIYYLIPGLRDQKIIAPLWRFLTFTMNFGLDSSKTGAFTQAWSLCVEEHFYLLLPFIVFWMMRRPSVRKVAIVASMIMGGGILIRAVLWLQFIQPLLHEPNMRPKFLEYIYYPTYNRLDGLLVGVLIAALKLFRPLVWDRATAHGNALLGAGVLVLVGAFAICQSMFSFATAVVGYPLLAVGFGLVVMAGLSSNCIIAKWRFFGATLIATLSYSLYLTHKAVMHFDDRVFLAWIESGTAIHCATFLSTFFAVAGILYLAVERQGFRIRDRLLPKQLRELTAPTR